MTEKRLFKYPDPNNLCLLLLIVLLYVVCRAIARDRFHSIPGYPRISIVCHAVLFIGHDPASARGPARS